jgi:peptide/nickel transport system permease protein
MTAYIIRRCLYAIPTLIGVNVFVFALFFFVNSPDDMARFHVGRRATPDKLDAWKREHSLDLPYFHNAGWRRIGSLAAVEKENKAEFTTAGTGTYALVIETPASAKEAQERTLRVQCSDPKRLVLPNGFGSDGAITLPADTLKRRFVFEIAPNTGSQQQTEAARATGESEAPALTATFTVQSPAPLHRVLLEYKAEQQFLSRFTQTIFFQRSVKMLFFSYGKSDDGRIIGDEIVKRIVPSLSIAIPVLFLAMFVDIFFSMLAAFYRGTYVDYWGVILCVLLMSISGLFYIMGGQVLFSKALRLVPISGYDYGVHSIKFVALPIAIIIISGMGGSIRFYRTVFLEEINKDYVRTARAKGLSEASVLFIHTLKNAMLPILTSVVVGLPFLFAGNLLLESFFAVPGMGSFMLDAIQRQDFAIVQAMVCLGSFLYIVGLVMTDISYTLVDPRVRLE